MKEEIITLMMVTYNRLDLTKQTMVNLFENTTTKFNLVIIDNASTDGTVEYLNELEIDNDWKMNDSVNLEKLTVVYNDENKGIAIGRNQALKIADSLDTDWYCTIDNDVLLHSGWLEECVDILKACPGYGGVGVSFEEIDFPIVTKNGKTFQDKQRSNLGTACAVFSKKLHKMIGFFTTEFEKYGEEDADFGFRAGVAGFKFAYLTTKGIHLGEDKDETGEYRIFKNECRKKNLAQFKRNCGLYARGEKALYIPFKGE